jgi:HK97 family phage portal protein
MSDFWYEPVGQGTVAGVTISHETALLIDTVYDCIKLLAGIMGSLPLHVYERLPNGGKRRAVDHPLYELLHDEPNEHQTRLEYIEMLQGHVGLRGNAFVKIERDAWGTIVALTPLNPDYIRNVRRDGLDRIKYEWKDDAGNTKWYDDREIHHIKWFSGSGLLGYDPITYARSRLGLSQALEDHGARYFGNSCFPGAAIELPGKLTEDGEKHLKQQSEKAFSAANSHRLFIMQKGMKWQNLEIKHEAAQFLESRKFTKAQVANLYGVPLFLLNELEGGASYASVYEVAAAFVTFNLRILATRWQQAINRDLLNPGNRGQVDGRTFFAEFLFDDLLRGAPEARAAAFQTQFQNGAVTVNEWRAAENRNPVEGGDVNYVQMNLQPLSRAAQGPATNNEPGPQGDGEQSGEGAASLQSGACALRPLIDDAAERLTKAELRGLATRASKATDDRERFNEWLAEFYGSHRTYAKGVLVPLFGATNGSAENLDALLDTIAEGPRVSLQLAEDPAKVVAGWKRTRKAHLVAQINGKLGAGITENDDG